MQQSKTTIGFISSKKLGAENRDFVIVPVYMDRDSDVITGDPALDSYIVAQMTKREHKPTRASTLKLTAPESLGLTDQLNLKDIVVVGMGKKSAAPTTVEMLGIGKKVIDALGKDKTAIVLGAGKEAVDLADAMLRGSYVYDKEKSGLLGNKPSKLHIDFAVANPKCKAKAFAPREITTLASHWAANLATKPSNRLTPGVYAAKIERVLAPLGVKTIIVSEKSNDVTFRRMGGLNAVGKASMNGNDDARKPHAVVMEYDGTGGKEGVKPVVLIGKGVTFDSGGISLKPGTNMEDMKMDMHGSATVVATMRALAAMKAPVKVHAVVGLVENMPGAMAIKPGDVIKHFNGMTTEIINTDAEGRLVLADCMALAQERWGADNIASMVDAATLTGAIVGALSKERAGMFSNDDTMAGQIDIAGRKTANSVWHMPLDERYYKAVEAGIADLKNSSVEGPGSSTAAEYLHHFIKKDDDGNDKFPWTHLDIAGVAYGKDKIATGYGVHLLTSWIVDNYAVEAPKACKKHKCKEGGCHPAP